MKIIRCAVEIFALIGLLSVVAVAQAGDTKSFAKDGLSFDYPAGWSVRMTVVPTLNN